MSLGACQIKGALRQAILPSTRPSDKQFALRHKIPLPEAVRCGALALRCPRENFSQESFRNSSIWASITYELTPI